jgi:hypothetical protein
MDLPELAEALVSPLATVLLAWAIGNRLSTHWANRQKRREETRTAANEFYRLYGEFFAVWKLWNYSLKNAEDPERVARRWELLKRAAAAEAGVEALLVKLTSERRFDEPDIEALGRFRQGFQTLRQTMRDARKLDWGSSDHPEYAAFKRLASHVGRLVSTVDQGKSPTISEAQQALISVTSNVWERR